MSRGLIKIMAWEFDFVSMKGKVSHASYLGEQPLEYKLIDVKGTLCYADAGDPYQKTKVVANTGNQQFDNAVKRAWQDFCFEEHILNSNTGDEL